MDAFAIDQGQHLLQMHFWLPRLAHKDAARTQKFAANFRSLRQ